MSDGSSPAPPSCGSGATPAASPTASCPSSCCCCCVTNATIGNVRQFYGTTGFVSPNTGSTLYNGHAFDFTMTFSFAAGSGGTADCTCEWWEQVNLPAHSTHPANTWTEMMTVGSPGSLTFGPWDRRTVPCPAGGNLTVTITDPPSLGNAPGRTLTRTLRFRLIAKSGPGCTCGTSCKMATATQVLTMVNGNIDAAASSFTIGPTTTV